MPRPPSRCGGGWLLVPYITAKGRCPVRVFLEELKRQALAKYVQFQEVLRAELETRGPFEVGPPYWEGLGAGFYDIRWSGRCRIYCSLEGEQQIVMYIGCVKRWRTFESDDRHTCEGYRADFQSEQYDQEQREYLYRAREKGTADGPS